MKPDDMRELSSANNGSSNHNGNSVAKTTNANTNGRFSGPPSIGGANSFAREMAKKKEADIENSVSEIMGGVTDKLEQDKMEGVDEKEWV